MARANIRLSEEKLREIREVRKLLEAERPEILARAKVLKAKQDAELAEACQVLRDARIATGLSLADLESRTGMTRAALSRLENAKEPNPTVATLNRYAAALGKRLVIRLLDSA